MPKTEFESKYKIDDVEAAKNKLDKIGAKFISEYKMTDTYFVVPQKQNGANYLRVREQNGGGELHYTFVPDNYRTDEFETGVDNPLVMKEIIAELGFDLDVIVKKTRQKFSYNEAEIVLDDVEDLGIFLEIEAGSIEDVERIAKKIQLNDDDIVNDAGYPDLLRDRIKKIQN